MGVVMVVGRSNLQTDASTFNLVHGPQLERAIAQAREDAEHFLLSLADRLGAPLPAQGAYSLKSQLAAALRSLRSLPR